MMPTSINLKRLDLFALVSVPCIVALVDPRGVFSLPAGVAWIAYDVVIFLWAVSCPPDPEPLAKMSPVADGVRPDPKPGPLTDIEVR